MVNKSKFEVIKEAGKDFLDYHLVRETKPDWDIWW